MIVHLLLTAMLAQADPPTDQTCALEGTVVNAITGIPLTHATVTASRIRHSFTSSTDEHGRFAIRNLDPGTYSLRAERPGYVGEPYRAASSSRSGTPLEIAAGQAIKDLAIQLAPEALIYGRVIDENDDPVRSVNVVVTKREFGPAKQQINATDRSTSQADGSFVLGGLRAGTYIVCAFPQNVNTFGGGEGAKLKQPLRTCFPSALESASAAPIQVNPGDRLHGVEIRLQLGRLYTISGRIQFPRGVAADSTVQLMLSGPAGTDSFSRYGGSVSGGKFRYTGLRPGTYILHADSAALGTGDLATDATAIQHLIGKVDVQISDEDQTEILLPLAPGIAMAGQIRIEGAPPDTALPPQAFASSVWLEASGEPIPNAPVSSKGTFQFVGLIAGTYRVHLNNMPQRTYIKSIRFNQVEITGKDLDLAAGGGSLEILLSPNPASVSGAVRGEDGKPAGGAQIHVFLEDDFVRSVSADQNGAFRVMDLAPGDYQLFAFEDIENGISLEPSFRKNLASLAARVRLDEKSQETIELKVITKDTIEAAKIR
jgi:uncharacterized protein (DUF2141 family)